MTWAFQAIDRYGTSLGELTDTQQRKVRVPLNGLVTGSFVVDTGHSLANVCRQGDITLIKAYRNGSLLGLGPVAPNYNKVVNETTKTIAVNWTSAGWRLSRRIIPASKSEGGISYGTALAPIDRGTIAQTFINDINASSDSGIRIGTITASSNTFVGPWQYKNGLAAINELSATLDGFDYRFLATEPTSDSLGLGIGTFNCSAAYGALRPEAVFEYGDGKRNVASFTENGDVAGIMNKGYLLPPGFPDGVSKVLSYQDDQAIARSGMWYEDVINSDIGSPSMRLQLLTENVLVRRVPRMVITFQPTVDPVTGVMPQYGTDYTEGDIVLFRAVEYESETVNALFRMYAVEFDIDDQGNETATPVLLSQ